MTNKDADPETGLTEATIEMKPKYAPIPRDTRTILRQKTLLGETYVELSPGHKSSGNLPDGGSLPLAQVAPTVELDEIFRSFDEPTRKAFQIWLNRSSDELGWVAPERAIVGAYTEPIDTWADMSQVLVHETWPEALGVRNVSYYCAAMAGPAWPPLDRPDFPADEDNRARQTALAFLRTNIPPLWPNAASGPLRRQPKYDGVMTTWPTPSTPSVVRNEASC